MIAWASALVFPRLRSDRSRAIERDLLRVAIDARLLAYQTAGTSTYIRGLVQGLREARPELALLAIASRKDPALTGLGTVPHRLAWTPCHHRWERWTLGVELANLAVDVLHSPDFISPVRLGRRWARVITVHDLAFLRFPDLVTKASHRYYSQIFRATAEAERIIAVSESTRGDLLDLVSSSLAPKIVVIPEGVDPSFSAGGVAELDRKHLAHFGIDGPYFLYVGTIEPRKNLPRLIRAFERFRAITRQPNVCLVIAGGRGWLADESEVAIAAAGDSVRYLGRVESSDLVALYRGALALVLVSLYEGFGLPILEAMACGTPTLASSTGSLPELVGDAGIVVDPNNEDLIASSLKRLWNDAELRDNLSALGLERARHFTWPNVAIQTAEVYCRAAACVS
jgi:glycosyltransferase involved in cell wall biosynthesis